MNRFILIFLLICTPCFAAVDFDGSDDLVNVGSGTTLDSMTTRTISAWVKVDTVGQFNQIYSKADTAADGCWTGWYFGVGTGDGTRRVYIFHGAATTDLDVKSADNAIPASGWFHVAATVNGSQHGELFVDGLEVSSYAQQNDGSGAYDYATSDDGRIGINSCSSAYNPFDGEITDLAIWDTVLTDSQILKLATEAKRMPYVIQKDNLVSYWPMTGDPDTSADGDTVSDLIENNDGTGDDGSGNTGLTWERDPLKVRSVN